MKLSAEKSQRGVAFLGLVMVLFLAAGLFVASKMASNPDLSFFNISEKAAGSEKCRFDWRSFTTFCSFGGYCDGDKFKCDKGLVCEPLPDDPPPPAPGICIKPLPCGSGLYCSASPRPKGSVACQSSSAITYCCPKGQIIVNGNCKGQPSPGPTSSGGGAASDELPPGESGVPGLPAVPGMPVPQ